MLVVVWSKFLKNELDVIQFFSVALRVEAYIALRNDGDGGTRLLKFCFRHLMPTNQEEQLSPCRPPRPTMKFSGAFVCLLVGSVAAFAPAPAAFGRRGSETVRHLPHKLVDLNQS